MKELKITFNNPERVLTLKERTNYCRHASVEIDPDNRTITCVQCGSLVDPFEWMASQAVSENVDIRRIWQLKNNISKLQAEIQKLEKIKIGLLNEVGKLRGNNHGG